MDEDFRGVSPTSVRGTLDEGPGWRVQQNGAILLVKSNKLNPSAIDEDSRPVQVNLEQSKEKNPAIQAKILPILLA
jgi:hypothetical protein